MSTKEVGLTPTFTVDVRYTIQLTEKAAADLLQMYMEHSNKDAATYLLAESLQEAIAWRSCNIVDAIIDDADDATEEFLAAMGVD